MLRCIFYIVYAILPKNILVFNTLIFHAIGCIMYVFIFYHYNIFHLNRNICSLKQCSFIYSNNIILRFIKEKTDLSLPGYSRFRKPRGITGQHQT